MANIAKVGWERIVFALINKLTFGGKSPFFSRTQLMSTSCINDAVAVSAILGHKVSPQNPVETIQKTLQNLRDKNFVEFLGNGKYKLTEIGKEEMLSRCGN